MTDLSVHEVAAAAIARAVRHHPSCSLSWPEAYQTSDVCDKGCVERVLTALNTPEVREAVAAIMHVRSIHGECECGHKTFDYVQAREHQSQVVLDALTGETDGWR